MVRRFSNNVSLRRLGCGFETIFRNETAAEFMGTNEPQTSCFSEGSTTIAVGRDLTSSWADRMDIPDVVDSRDDARVRR